MEKDVTRSIEEQLSAFLDGELPAEELQLLVHRLEREQEYRQTLARYAAIGSVLRKDPVHVSGDELRQRLMIAMRDESLPAGETVVEAKAQSSYAKRGLLAAAVAVLAVVGVYSGGLPGPGGPNTAEVREVETDAYAATQAQLRVENEATATAAQAASRSSTGANAVRQPAISPLRMTSYLVSHGEFSRSFQGSIVDSRIVVQQASFEQ